MLQLVCRSSHSRTCWATSEDVVLPKLAFRYFFPLNSLFRKPDNRVLVGGQLPIFLYRWQYLKLRWPCISHCYLSWNPVEYHSHPLVSSQWYLVLAVTNRKHHECSTFLAVRAYKLAFPLDVKLGKAQKT